MRNLKKFLALVLAVMMTLSLMVTANAAIDTDAAVTDKDSVTEEFKEAVAVLNGLGIITGYEDGTFRPDKTISRQETTALIYRLHSGDVKDEKNNLYSTADNIKQFTDVNRDGGQQWSAGYIGYCANQGIIRGVSDTRFAPTHEVTGYQVLAMVLRAIGYGQNKEFDGTGWQTRVATTATQLGILKNVNNTNYAGTLSSAASRELVAEIIFQAALLDTVTYTPGLGYVVTGSSPLAGGEQGSLADKKFDLDYSGYQTIDEWGRPGYYWFTGPTLHEDPDDRDYNVVATIMPKPEVEYTKAVDECDLAHDLDIKTSATFDLFVNNNKAITNNYLVVATDTVTQVGGQGRITEVYRDLRNDHGNVANRVVMIDTFLGKVTKVEKEVLDAAGHQMIKARLTLNVYDVAAASEAGGTQNLIIEKPSGDWEFSKGDMVLFNAYTDNEHGLNANKANSDHSSSGDPDRAAFEAEKVAYNASRVIKNATNVTMASPVLGKQSTIYWNQGKHNVDGQDKLDQLELFLDVAGSTVNTTFAWYYDAEGNLIGIGDAPNTTQYGIITSIYSAFNQGSNSTTGEAVAIASVKYADGTEGTVTIDRFLVNSQAGTNWGHITASATTNMVDTTTTNGGNNIGNTTAGSTELLPVYDYGTAATSGPMTASSRNTTSVSNAVQAAYLYVAPVAGVNAANESANSTATTPWGDDDTYGIIKGNLFKFVSSGDGDMTAIEVAGTNSNGALYKGNYNELTTAQRELSKNFGYLTVGTTTIRMDNDTKIIVRGCEEGNAHAFAKATNSISVYDGIGNLPANIVIPNGTEIDWADTDDNGIADVVYVYGVKKGNTGFSLFYYNGGTGQWSGSASTGSGWLRGWLDGEQTDLVFNDKVLFDRVQQSTTTYGGHLFAVKLLDGEVEDLLVKGDIGGTGDKDLILIDSGSATPLTPKAGGIEIQWTEVGYYAMGGGYFGTGEANGNDYAAKTSAIWYQDLPTTQVGAASATCTDIRYNSSNNTIEVWDYTNDANGVAGTATKSTVYNLSGTSARLGDSLNYLNMDRVNDVTIVFDPDANNTIRQVYVTTRPDITSGTTSSVTLGGDSSVVRDLSNTVASTTSDANVDAIIKGIGPNTVVYCPKAPGTVVGTSKATDVMYFPFVGAAADSSGATLNIYKDGKGGTLVYSEAYGSTVVGSHYFVINFVDTAKNVGAALKPTGSFAAGTYYFEIIGAGSGEVLSSNYFTLQ